MSIINDALKKTAESIQQNTNSQLTENAKPAGKKKNFLLYALIIAAGLFLGNLTLNMLAHRSKPGRVTPKPQEVNIAAPEIKAPLEKIEQTAQTNNTVSTVAAPEPIDKADFQLSGIFFSDEEKYALLNNQILKEGEMIRGTTVKTITTNSVELEKQGQTLILSTGNK
jgi:hypothetical protein